jgi:hypothetical protein
MGKSFAEAARPAVEASLEPGEALLGIVAATHQRTFGGQLYALGVTQGRLLLQPVGRKMESKGPPRVVTPDTLVSAEADGAGSGWWSVPSIILDAAAIAVTLHTTDGEKLKLTMMRGGGTLSGGPLQAEGLRALVEWMQRNLGDR